MDSKIKKGLTKGFIILGLFIALTLITTTPDVKSSGISGPMWFINSLVFIGAILLIVTSWGAHLKNKLNKKK